MDNIKYGLLEYHTENIGDEVQSIAARRFLPHIDYYFDRDNINATKTNPNGIIKLIMNGWYTHHPENWPPKIPNLKPLLIAMHIEQDALDGTPAKAFVSSSSKAFLQKFGPVGTRNYPSLELLKQNNIKSFFSGCITLTLIPDQNIKRKDYVLAVDVPDKVYLAMCKNTTRTIFRLNTNCKKDLDRETRYLLAELWLYFYQSAHAVVTTRLHTMLPCLAFNTPVLAISGRDPKRYKGLIDLTNHATTNKYLRDSSIFNLDCPPKNPEVYLELRKDLEKTCSNFTKFDSKKSFLDGKSIESLLSNPKIIQFFFDATHDAWLLGENKPQLAALQQTIKDLQQKPTPIAPQTEMGIKDSTKSLARAIKRKLKNF